MNGVGRPDLTREQLAAAEHTAGHVRICGAAGTGKTTALLARYVTLLKHHPASALLVLCRNRPAADRFRDAVLGQLAGGFDALPITTFGGLTFDLVTRFDGPVQMTSQGDQRDEVARVLAAEGPNEWPESHRYVGRRAFTDQVAAALFELEESGLTDDEVMERAERAGAGARWRELCAFAPRYQRAVAGRGMSWAACSRRAAELLDTGGIRADLHGRYQHVLVDDYEASPPLAPRLLRTLADIGVTVTVAGNPSGTSRRGNGGALEAFAAGFAPVLDVALDIRFRNPAAPRVVVCNHPSLEAEAIAGEILSARAGGQRWNDIAVLVRSMGSRSEAVVRALTRHGVPAVTGRDPTRDQPVVQAIIDVLRWVDGDSTALERLLASPVSRLEPDDLRDLRRRALSNGAPLEADPRLAHLVTLRSDLAEMAPGATPADLAFEIWTRALGRLAGSGDGAQDAAVGAALDAVTAFIGSLQRRADRRADERLSEYLAATDAGASATGDWYSPRADASVEAVTVTSIAAASGREWRTVVVAGCVEGELPRLRPHPELFDRWVLRAPSVPTAVERRQQSLVDERALFDSACDRATQQIIGSVAAQPGVLASRFVESWRAHEPRLVPPPSAPAGHRPKTAGVEPVFPDQRLHLSASRLSTYDDCPLRYAYEYLLGARSDGNVYASLGSLVHAVLAEFLDPNRDKSEALTRDRLVAVAERHWRDDIAPYRPQVEEIRRDFFAMLDAWWQAEGSQEALSPQVLDVERRFEIEVGPHTLTGFIDRLDRADDGAGIRVVDYKTGKSKPTAAQVADNIQLAVYHLGATRDPTLSALGAPTQLRLLYLREMRAFEQEVTPDHAVRTESTVLSVAGAMLAEGFEPSVDADCRTCSYHRLCPLQDEGRQVAG